MPRIFLDTNIVLDFLDDQRIQHRKALELLEFLVERNWEIVISEDMMTTIFYLRKRREQVLGFFRYILKNWRIVPYGAALLSEAVELALERKCDLEDLLQCLCAKREECRYLVTQDRSFVSCGVRVLDTQTMIELLNGEEEMDAKGEA